jgi:hypothetical protein
MYLSSFHQKTKATSGAQKASTSSFPVIELIPAHLGAFLGPPANALRQMVRRRHTTRDGPIAAHHGSHGGGLSGSDLAALNSLSFSYLVGLSATSANRCVLGSRAGGAEAEKRDAHDHLTCNSHSHQAITARLDTFKAHF